MTIVDQHIVRKNGGPDFCAAQQDPAENTGLVPLFYLDYSCAPVFRTLFPLYLFAFFSKISGNFQDCHVDFC
jgi:hypothetical protein